MVFVVGLEGALECAAKVRAVEISFREHLHEVPDSDLSLLCDGLHELHEELVAVDNAVKNGEQTIDIAKIWRSITEIITQFGMFSLHAEKDIRSLKASVRSLKAWKQEMEGEKKLQGIYTEIGEWVSVCFDEIGPERIMQHLPAEFRKHKPLHWSCPYHQQLLPLLEKHGIKWDEFDYLRDFKAERNQRAHGSGSITVENFKSRYDEDSAMLNVSPNFTETQKMALRTGMAFVHQGLSVQAELNKTGPVPDTQTGPIQGIRNVAVQDTFGKRRLMTCGRRGGRVGVAAAVVGYMAKATGILWRGRR